MHVQFIIIIIIIIIIRIILCYLAEAFIQSDLQFMTKQGTNPFQQCGVKGPPQGPNSRTDLIAATPGPEPPTFRVLVMYPSNCSCRHEVSIYDIFFERGVF